MSPPALKIWGRTNSQNVKKALWIAYELGLPFESVIVGGQFGGTRTPEYLALNPNVTVPTLQDGAFTLWESNAIVRYLTAQYAESAGRPELWPADAQVRAAADKWMDWQTSGFIMAFKPLFYGIVRTPPAERDAAQIAAALKDVEDVLAVPEATLATQPYLSGTAFGIGDIPLGCSIYAYFEMDIKHADLPNLHAWYERLKARPAYQKAVMTPLT